MRGKIDRQTVYLPDDQLPAFTLSLSDLQDPGKVRGWRSTTLRIIANSDGQQALGGEHMAEVDTFRADAPPVLRIGEDSSPLFEAPVVPLSRDRNETQAVSIFGNAKWFEFAKETKLREFDFGQALSVVKPTVEEPTRMVERMVNSWTDLEQIDYWPLVNFGALDSPFSESDNVSPGYLHPALRVHRLIGDPLRGQRFRIRPRGTLTRVWKRIVILDPGAPLASELTSPGNRVVFGHNVGLAGATIPGTDFADATAEILNCVPTFDAGGNAPSNSVFEMPFDGDCRIRVRDMALDVDTSNPAIVGRRVRLSVVDSFTSVPFKGWISEPIQSGDTVVRFDADFLIQGLSAGDQLSLGIQFDQDSATINPLGLLTIPAASQSFVEFLPFSDLAPLATDPYEYRRGLSFASAAPDITLAELVSAVCQHLCLIVDTRTDGTVNLWFESEYLRKPARGVPVRDWIGRIDHTKPPLKRRIETPVSVRMGFAEDANDALLWEHRARNRGIGFGDAVYTFGGGVKQDEVRTLPWAATINRPAISGLSLPTLRKRDGEAQEDSRSFAPRILLSGGLREGNWTWNGSARTTYPFTYFERADQSFPTLGFEGVEGLRGIGIGFLPPPVGLLTKYHLQRLRRLNGLVLETYLRVWDHELPDFDHGIPTLVDDGGGPAWYYAQECKGHRFGQEEPSKWVLVPISTREASTAIDNPDIAYPEQNEPDACWAQGAFPDTMETVQAVATSDEQAAFEATAGTGGILVSGAGTSAANGIYTEVAPINGRPSYENDDSTWQLVWYGFYWLLWDGSIQYKSNDDVATPDLCTTWIVHTGATAPAPTVTVDTGDLVVGDRIFIRDHPAGGPPSNDWAEHTGHIAEFVGIGNGVGGGMWNYSIPAPGVVIKDLETPGVPSEYWQVYGCVDTDYSIFNGYSGRVGIRYLLPIASLDPGPPATTNIEWPTTETGATVQGSVHDACRLCVLQYATEVDVEDATWYDSPNMAAVPVGDAPLYTNGWALFTGTFTANFPGGANWIRAKWMRGGQLQGYSEARAATA